MKGLLSGFVEQAERLREERPVDLMAAMKTLLSGFLPSCRRDIPGRDFRRRHIDGSTTDFHRAGRRWVARWGEIPRRSS
ncbi:hypothetical protein ACVWZV_000781 [Bradyrhizobium sp. GM5.1]